MMFTALRLVAALLVNFGVAFLVMYAYDDGFMWRSDISSRLTSPSIFDVGTENCGIVDQYVRDEICPAYHYFVLRAELSGNISGGGEIISGIVLQIPTMLAFARGVQNIGLFKNGIVCILFSCLTCGVGAILMRLLYKRFAKIYPFRYNEHHLEQDRAIICKADNNYGESDQVALNNLIISRHYSYLRSVQKTVRTRKVIRSLLSAIALVVYVLFFMQLD